MNWYCTEADDYSIWPVAQQIIGVSTAIQNICLLFRDVALKVNDFCINFFSLSEKTTQSCVEAAVNSARSCSMNPDEFTKKHEFYIRDGIEPNITRRVAFIAIGCIRAIPLLGTLYSYYVILEREPE